jgi:Tol biopolymer transport system component
MMNWQTRAAELLPASERVEAAAWSPDQRFIAATTNSEIRLFDFHTRRWSLLATAIDTSAPHWSRDGQYIYYEDLSEGAGHPTYRMRIRDRKVERVFDAKRIPQSNVTGYAIIGLSPGDQPIATVRRGNSDLYALDVDLP